MINLRISARLALVASVILLPRVASAQHDVISGGGSTRDVAVGESSSRPASAPRRTVRAPSTARKPRPVIRQGITAEQYNQQGDEFLAAKQYDAALEAYEKAVQVKSLPAAYYSIGWIYNDRENYDDALLALQQAVRLEPSDAQALYELGYAYRGLKRYDEALN